MFIILISFQVYVNTLRNWVSLDADRCLVKPIMFSTDSTVVHIHKLITLAERLGWEIFQTSRFSKNEVPFVRDMYIDAARRVPNCRYYMYSNGDILYSHGLIDTLQAVSQVGNTLLIFIF